MLPGGQQRVVLNGYLPERNIQTGIGDVGVKFIHLLLYRYLQKFLSLDPHKIC